MIIVTVTVPGYRAGGPGRSSGRPAARRRGPGGRVRLGPSAAARLGHRPESRADRVAGGTVGAALSDSGQQTRASSCPRDSE
jgi:hypothetical protein